MQKPKIENLTLASDEWLETNKQWVRTMTYNKGMKSCIWTPAQQIEISEMKNDISVLKQDVAVLKQDMKEVKKEIKILKKNLIWLLIF